MHNLKKLYKELADQTGLHIYQVEDIWKSQFEGVMKTFELKEDKPARIPGLFTFRVKAGRRNFLNQQTKEKDE